ncbi:7967_t:CDS:2 [Acaulospora colombiana]|uniref:7967_t:CDS:1 n=1 Tax=Acaulospora colombiana TaxID=27376 RepID=A0ACA9NJ27_9GLOM|nr:7967_t:CDS:2 [Acaulospora colombiana]
MNEKPSGMSGESRCQWGLRHLGLRTYGRRWVKRVNGAKQFCRLYKSEWIKLCDSEHAEGKKCDGDEAPRLTRVLMPDPSRTTLENL